MKLAVTDSVWATTENVGLLCRVRGRDGMKRLIMGDG